MMRTKHESHPKLRVAAYCRSVSSTEQNLDLEAQISYYTKKINSNPDWIMAGIFTDTCICESDRPEFSKMLHECRQRKIDLILVKSITRFTRNIADCLNTVPELRELGTAVIFEKENLNTMDADFDAFISLMADLSRAECEHLTHHSAHMPCMEPIIIPKKRTWKKTSYLPGRPDKTIYFRME